MLRNPLAFSFIAVVLVSCSQAPTPSTDLAVSPSPATEEPQPIAPASTAAPQTAAPQTTEPKQSEAPRTAIEKRSATKPNSETAKPDSETTQPDSKKSAQPGKILFSCLTDNGKKILLQDAGETINYRFGPPDGKPELQLDVPRDQAATWQWKGIGRSMSYSVNVPNGETTYSVFWSADRIDQKVESGVNVLINNKLAATVSCADQIVHRLEGVDLKALN